MALREQYARLDRFRADLVAVCDEVAKLRVAIETNRSIEGLVEIGTLTKEMALTANSAVDLIKTHSDPRLRSSLEGILESRHPNWMYTNSLESALKEISLDLVDMLPYMKQWVSVCQGRYNFIYFFKLVRSGVADEYATIATQELDNLEYSREYVTSRIANTEHVIARDLKLVERIRKEGVDVFLDNVAEGDFESVMTCPMSLKILRITWDKITGSPTTLSIAKQTGFDIEHPVIRTVIDSTDGKIGHSGTSVGWLRAQMRVIFQEGWRTWVVACLKANHIINEDGSVCDPLLTSRC